MKTTTVVFALLIIVTVSVSAQGVPNDYPDVPYPQPQFVQQCWHKTAPDRPQEWVTLTVVHDMPSYLWNLSYKWSVIKIAFAADLKGWGSPLLCPGQTNTCFFDRYIGPYDYYYLDGYDSIIRSIWRGSIRIPESLGDADVWASGAWQFTHHSDTQMPCFHTVRDDVCIIPFMLRDSDGNPRGFNYPMPFPPAEDEHVEIDYGATFPCPQVLSATPRSWMPVIKNGSG